MKKIIETVKNIWRIEDLKTRILITLLLLLSIVLARLSCCLALIPVLQG